MRIRSLLTLATLLVAVAPPASASVGSGEGFRVERRALDAVRSLFRRSPARRAETHVAAFAPNHTTLVLYLDDATELRLALSAGQVLVGEASVARYHRGGELETAWRELVTDATQLPTPEVVNLVRHWAPDGLIGQEARAARAVRQAAETVDVSTGDVTRPQALEPAGPGGFTISLDRIGDPGAIEALLRQASRLASPTLRLTVPNGKAYLGDFSIGSEEHAAGHLLVLRGTADLYGNLTGNVVAIDGDVVVHSGAIVTGDVLAYNGEVLVLGGEITGDILTLSPITQPATALPADVPALSTLAVILRKAAGLVGVFLSLGVIGFGLVLFARPNLEIVSDTVSNSFGRAFMVGLIGQMLLLPTFGMLVVGLILSVVGVLLLPFAVIVYGLLVVLAVLGGFLAVAHAMGETYTRRRMAFGASVGSPNSYRFLLIGLAAVASLWGAWVVFGWVPVAGQLIQAAAILVTWLLGTAGFGAALLSRAGVREHFAGRFLPTDAMTDEYLWATPQFGVSAIERASSKTPSPPPAPPPPSGS